jgi:hypothetical protein
MFKTTGVDCSRVTRSTGRLTTTISGGLSTAFGEMAYDALADAPRSENGGVAFQYSETASSAITIVAFTDTIATPISRGAIALQSNRDRDCDLVSRDIVAVASGVPESDSLPSDWVGLQPIVSVRCSDGVFLVGVMLRAECDSAPLSDSAVEALSHLVTVNDALFVIELGCDSVGLH